MAAICCTCCAKDKPAEEFQSKLGRILKTCATCRGKQKTRDSARKPNPRKRTSGLAEHETVAIQGQHQAPFVPNGTRFTFDIRTSSTDMQQDRSSTQPSANFGFFPRDANQKSSKAIASAVRAQTRRAQASKTAQVPENATASKTPISALDASVEPSKEDLPNEKFDND